MSITHIVRFLRDDNGATALEYAMIASLIAVALAATFAATGDSVISLFDQGVGNAANVIGERASSIP